AIVHQVVDVSEYFGPVQLLDQVPRVARADEQCVLWPAGDRSVQSDADGRNLIAETRVLPNVEQFGDVRVGHLRRMRRAEAAAQRRVLGIRKGKLRRD